MRAHLSDRPQHAHMATTEETDYEWSMSDPQIAVAIVLGAVLALLGIAAPLVTGARGEFLGIGRNYLHDGVHILSGLAGLAAGYYAGGVYADRYNIAMGATYGLVAILGFVAFDTMNDMMGINTGANYFHLFLMLVFLGAGALARRRGMGRDRQRGERRNEAGERRDE